MTDLSIDLSDPCNSVCSQHFLCQSAIPVHQGNKILCGSRLMQKREHHDRSQIVHAVKLQLLFQLFVDKLFQGHGKQSGIRAPIVLLFVRTDHPYHIEA